MPDDEKGDVKTDIKTDPKQLDSDEKILELLKNPEEALEAFRKMRDTKRESTDEAKKLRLKQEAADKAQKAKDDAALAEQGKFKELAEGYKSEAETAKKVTAKKMVDFELRLAAIQAGALDPSDVLSLCNRSGIKISDDFETVEGAEEAVEAVKKGKPYLFKAEDDNSAGAPNTDRKPPIKSTISSSDSLGITGVDRIAAGLAKKK